MDRIIIQSLLNRDPPSPESSIGDIENSFKNRHNFSAPQPPPTPAPEPQQHSKDQHAEEKVEAAVASRLEDHDIEAAGILMKFSSQYHSSGWTADDFDAAGTLLQVQSQAKVFTTPRTLLSAKTQLSSAYTTHGRTRSQSHCKDDVTMSEDSTNSDSSQELSPKRQRREESQHRQTSNTRQNPRARQKPNARQNPSAWERPSLGPLRTTGTTEPTRNEVDDDGTTPDGSPEHSPKNVISRRRRSITYSHDFPNGLCIVINEEESDENDPLPLGPRRKGSNTRLHLGKTNVKDS